MNELTRFHERTDRFQNSLLTSIERFRNGEDHLGLDTFLKCMDDLENIIDIYLCLGEPKLKIDELLPAVQKLYINMKNQDVIGMTDVLEFTIYPLTREWFERCDEK